MKQNSSKIGLN